jgi:hypothetical protein
MKPSKAKGLKAHRGSVVSSSTPGASSSSTPFDIPSSPASFKRKSSPFDVSTRSSTSSKKRKPSAITEMQEFKECIVKLHERIDNIPIEAAPAPAPAPVPAPAPAPTPTPSTSTSDAQNNARSRIIECLKVEWLSRKNAAKLLRLFQANELAANWFLATVDEEELMRSWVLQTLDVEDGHSDSQIVI